MAKAKKDSPVKSYVAVRRVEHEGDLYLAGETIAMPEDDGRALVAIGAVREAPAEPAKK